MSTTFMTETLIDLVRSVPFSTNERIEKASSLALVASLAGGAAGGAALFHVTHPLALVAAPGLVAVVLVVASLQMRNGRAIDDDRTPAACAHRCPPTRIQDNQAPQVQQFAADGSRRPSKSMTRFFATWITYAAVCVFDHREQRTSVLRIK
jgi:hypothetical protein